MDFLRALEPGTADRVTLGDGSNYILPDFLRIRRFRDRDRRRLSFRRLGHRCRCRRRRRGTGHGARRQNLATAQAGQRVENLVQIGGVQKLDAFDHRKLERELFVGRVTQPGLGR